MVLLRMKGKKLNADLDVHIELCHQDIENHPT